jgi:hypothetical protein
MTIDEAIKENTFHLAGGNVPHTKKLEAALKLDFDKLYDEAVEADRFGVCPNCDEEHYLCWCGVCFKYCHDDYFHEPIDFEEPI